MSLAMTSITLTTTKGVEVTMKTLVKVLLALTALILSSGAFPKFFPPP